MSAHAMAARGPVPARCSAAPRSSRGAVSSRRLTRARAVSSPARDAADGTADIPDEQDAISVVTSKDASVGSLTRAILALEDDGAEAMFECILEWAVDVKQMELYEAQEEAIMELVEGNSVLLTTPTGSGKTLVATAAIAAATARGDAAWYTAPLKALVTEKFFQLVKEFGAKNVGLLTGDASVNPTAPIICCTAEVLANAALRRGRELDCGLVVADEFHFYADRDRGWAWQVPMVELPNAQFLLMSATFGDAEKFRLKLEKNAAGRDAVIVGSDAQRPVPLEFEYRTSTLLESVAELLETRKTPVYIVNFTQKAANERAQDLCSTLSLTAEEKAALKKELAGFKFDTPVGNELRRFIGFGVGVHHAGLLPKYRLLVEKLAGKGLLKAICGTDTLGVGVNVPIRAVLFTQLCKFDGSKVRTLTTREFQQIAGRAGRRGFDDKGFVWCQAPPHVIENLRLEQKALERAKNGGKAKKFKKAQPPEKGFVMWNEDTFRKNETGAPETLESSFEVTHGMILAVLSRRGDGKRFLRDLLVKNHEPLIRKRRHQKRAISMYRSLRDAGIIIEDANASGAANGRAVTLGFDLSDSFSLTQPLSLFAVEFLPTLALRYGEDHDARSRLRDEAYALDVLSTLEAVLDTPAAVTNAQLQRMKRRAMARMKNDGVEFDDRVATLDELEVPKPLEAELEAHYEPFKKRHPYVGNETVKPKAIAREMYELGFDFNRYVTHHGLNRSEGVVLRYLTDAYKSLVQNVPENLKSKAVADLEAWLGETIRQVDSSLIDEWEALKDPIAAAKAAEGGGSALESKAAEPSGAFTASRAFRVMARNAAFRWVQLIAEAEEEDVKELAAHPPPRGREKPWTVDELYASIDAYYETHESVDVTHDARSPDLFLLADGDDDDDEASDGDGGEPASFWRVEQKILDPDGDLDWVVFGEVDLAASEEAGTAVLRLGGIRREGVVAAEASEPVDAAARDIPDEDDMWAAYEEEEAFEDDEEEEEMEDEDGGVDEEGEEKKA